MSLTTYHAKYYAYELTRRCSSDSVEKITGAVASAQVDLNPHQVDAAVFAFASPLSKGAVLADEVGLGKTIEAGLVISQKWAERKRRILVITPSNLRKQWHQELSEKFFLPCRILESKSYNDDVKQGNFRPFETTEAIVICSYQFARSKATDVHATPWDIVIIDEAHRLRNAYKPSNVIANTLKQALAQRHKLLLTATPLQNSLLELYGLVSFIDEHLFGDLKSFRERFANASQEHAFTTLRARLKPICHRTLRRQVSSYIPYTRRLPIVEEFTPDESEDRLYHLVSDYLQRDNLQALPASQRSLMTLVLRKLLASSTYAIAGALTTLSTRLKQKLRKQNSAESLAEEIDSDYEALAETAEEWPDDADTQPLSAADRVAIEQEIADLDGFTQLATSIDHNAKGKALLKALEVAFARTAQINAQQKAIIFTESLRTQNYLLRVLADSAFKEGIVLFNGSNNDERSKAIYTAWLARHQGTDRVTGSRTADMRSALVDYFREEGCIMIATEAGAEGINLQFCSLVVNYDLPWNPQRIEQRIGRCHRYGQKHDVVVVNFLNRKNEADRRVYQLLSEKFRLFEGIFGASDEVLGAIESGVDFEKRIADIYQRCRKHEDIKIAFDQLQLELNFEISEAMTHTRQKLLEHFDDEVREKLRVRDQTSKANLDRFERMLIQLTRHELDGIAEFLSDSSFRLTTSPFPEISNHLPLGVYELPRRSGDAHLYRLNHPLAEVIVARAKTRNLPPAEIRFDYGAYDGRISIVEPLINRSGWLTLSLLTVESFNQAEDHLIFSAVTDDGQPLDENTAARLFTLPGSTTPLSKPPLPPGENYVFPPLPEGEGRGEGIAVSQVEENISQLLATITQQRQTAIQLNISERNTRFFDDETEKLDGWADDLKIGLEREIKELDRQIKEAKREARQPIELEQKLALHKQVKELENRRNEKRRRLFEAQDEIDARKETLISAIEARLAQRSELSELFALRWRVV